MGKGNSSGEFKRDAVSLTMLSELWFSQIQSTCASTEKSGSNS